MVSSFYLRESNPSDYPCKVVNRFHCPYESNVDKREGKFNVDDLFRLSGMSFAVEQALAKARMTVSGIKIKSKTELLCALSYEYTFSMILKQGEEAHEINKDIRIYLVQNRDVIVDYFMNIRDKLDTEEYVFY